MATSVAGTTSWWTASDWLNPQYPVFALAGTGTVEYAWSAGTPPSTISGSPLTSPSAYGMPAPIPGVKLYIRVTSGSVTISYDKKDGPSFDLTTTQHVYSGGSGSDTGRELTNAPYAGFDYVTVRNAANPYEFAAFFSAPSVGLSASDVVNYAVVILALLTYTPGYAFRLRALKYATDQTGSISGWSSLMSKTMTTAYADVLVSSSSYVTLDVKTLLDELKAVSGWSASSPVQFVLRPTTAAVLGLDSRIQLDCSAATSRLALSITAGGGGGGGGPSPPIGGIGGP